MTLVDHFRTLQRYETWANDLALASLESVPQAARGGTQFVRAVQVLAHNQLARKVSPTCAKPAPRPTPPGPPSSPISRTPTSPARSAIQAARARATRAPSPRS